MNRGIQFYIKTHSSLPGTRSAHKNKPRWRKYYANVHTYVSATVRLVGKKNENGKRIGDLFAVNVSYEVDALIFQRLGFFLRVSY